MSARSIVGCLLLAASSLALSQTAIVCKPETKSGRSLWPEIYLSKTDQVCFDVLGWMDYRGQNCARNGESIQWEGIIIVMVGDDSQGRDRTQLRVRNPVVTSERLEYIVEWSRGAGWRPMQRVSINRITGVGVNYFVDMHDGETIQCQKVAKKI